MTSIMTIVILLWVASIVGILWVWDDASRKRGSNIGCLWALVVLALGPIGFIAYLIVRDAD